MIPLKDDNPVSITPFVTYALIIINVIIFLNQLTLDSRAYQEFVYTYGAVPLQLIHGQNLHSIFTSMFLHGGFGHLLGNMLFLWIFADNIEYLTGHGRFIVFYILCGLAAFLTHFIMAPTSQVPMIGASGAISGVLGAYAIRFPRARVHVLWIFFFIISVDRIPAAIVLGLWFLLQILSAMGASASSAGVAWYAHIGGFVAGILLIGFFQKRRVTVYFRR
ncbi:MAG: rhomboid family intramembrane serine protease [candidate division KSB1 bacterium]|nr:rhomboid family intramembrane serine protease [candidate division KSB1 bacterium]